MNETFTNYFKRLSKKSMARIGVVGIIVMIVLIFLFVSILISSSPVIEKDTYELGEKIRVDLNEEYKLKIITPSNTYIKKGNDKFVFKPKEIGEYRVVVYSGGDRSGYNFNVVKEKVSEEANNSENKEEVSGNNTLSNRTKESKKEDFDKENKTSDFNETENKEKNKTEEKANRSLEFDFNEKSEEHKYEPSGKGIIAGKPVKNNKTIKGNNSGKTIIRVPKQGENISVYKSGEKVDFDVKQNILESFAGLFSSDNRSNVKEVVIDNVDGEIGIEYYTPGPKINEEFVSKKNKRVTISAEEELNYSNITAYTKLSSEVKKENINLYHMKENSKENIDFIAKDMNNNSLIDTIEWKVPHLSTQIYEIEINYDERVFNALDWLMENQEKGGWGQGTTSLSVAFSLSKAGKLDSRVKKGFREWTESVKKSYKNKLPLEHFVILEGLEEQGRNISLLEESITEEKFRESIMTTGFVAHQLVESKEKEKAKKILVWLEKKQNPDGGWSFEGYEKSKFYPTSHAIGALIYAYEKGYYENETAIEKGLDFMLSKTYINEESEKIKENKSNEKWISSKEDSSATHKLCESVVMLENWDINNSLVDSGIKEIKKRQLENGSWDNHPSHTAVCLWALNDFEKLRGENE